MKQNSYNSKFVIILRVMECKEKKIKRADWAIKPIFSSILISLLSKAQL